MPDFTEEPTGEEYLKSKRFIVDLAERPDADIEAEITRFIEANGSFVCLSLAARYLRNDPKFGWFFDKFKKALLAGN